MEVEEFLKYGLVLFEKIEETQWLLTINHTK